MKRRKRSAYLKAGISAVLFLLVMVLVRTVDVHAVGPEGTKIGLSHLNVKVHELLGVNMVWYKITEILGYTSILLALMLCAVGVLQLARRRNIWKVDRCILALGLVYVLLGLLYVVFEVCIINYRPIVMPGDLHVEASFPSSHTMLACTIFGTAGSALNDLIYSEKPILQWVCYGLAAVMVVGRLLSGVHWLTDIMAGMLVGIALTHLYVAESIKA